MSSDYFYVVPVVNLNSVASSILFKSHIIRTILRCTYPFYLNNVITKNNSNVIKVKTTRNSISRSQEVLLSVQTVELASSNHLYDVVKTRRSTLLYVNAKNCANKFIWNDTEQHDCAVIRTIIVTCMGQCENG
jgi:hypothetical protein